MTSRPADFATAISAVEPGRVTLRGYPVEAVIAHASAGETLFLTLTARRPTGPELRVFDAILAACADHGFANTAAVAGRYVMSGSAHLPAALAAGLLSFGQNTGTAHLTAEMLLAIGGNDRQAASDAAIEAHIRELRAKRLAVPGLGHPIHRTIDPRERALRGVFEASTLVSPSVDLLDRVHRIAKQVIGRQLVLNVDGLFGALLLDMGFSTDAIFAVNIIGAMPGIAAHAIEERAQGRRLRIPPDEAISYADVPQGKSWSGEEKA